MAYVFNRLNELVSKSQARPTDILAQKPQEDVENANGAPASTPTAGPSSVIGGEQPRANASTEASTAVNSESRSKIMQKNPASEQFGGGVKVATGIADSIKGAKENLQNAANAYTTENQYGAFDRGNVSKALDGNDAAAQAEVSGFMTRASERPKDFGYDASSLEAQREQTRALQSQGGLQQVLREQQGADYTAGEARLDASLLRGSKAFGEQKQAIAQSFADFAKTQEGATAAAKTAQDSYVAARDSDKGVLRGELARLAGGIRSSAESNLGTMNASLAANRTAKSTEAAKALATDSTKRLGDIEKAARGVTLEGNQRADYDAKVSALRDMIANPQKYVSQDSRGYEFEDAVTADQQGDYNWLNETLGQGDRLSRREGFNPLADAQRKATVGTQLQSVDELIKTLLTVQALNPEMAPGADKVVDALKPAAIVKAAADNAGDVVNKTGGVTTGRPVPGQQVVDAKIDAQNKRNEKITKEVDKKTVGGGAGRPAGKTEAPKTQTIASNVAKAKKTVKAAPVATVLTGGLNNVASCFPGYQLIDMENGTLKRAEDIRLGDLARGGRVVSVRVAEVENEPLFQVGQALMTGSHSVVVGEDRGFALARDVGLEAGTHTGLVYNFIVESGVIYAGGAELGDDRL